MDKQVEVASLQAARTHLAACILHYHQAIDLLPTHAWATGPTKVRIYADLCLWLAHTDTVLRKLHADPSLEVAPDD